MHRIHTLSTTAVVALLTVLVVLGISRSPGGERVAALLNEAIECCLVESIDQRLERELATLEDPNQRAMLHHLVMLQIAEQARQARVAAISTAALAGSWSTQQAATRPRGESGIASGVDAPDATAMDPERRAVRTTDGRPLDGGIDGGINRWALIGCFALAVLWVVVRRA